MERLTSLYEEYQAQLQKFKSKMKPADGLFGFGTGLGEAPCHDVFAEKLEALLKELAEDPAFADSCQALEYIYRAPLAEPEKAAYWMMMAVHNLTLPLISRLDRAAAGELLEWYQEIYPTRDRLPPQNAVIKALKERSQKSGKRKGFFRFLN